MTFNKALVLFHWVEGIICFSNRLSLFLLRRYLSDEGIAELKGSAENITHEDIIRIALDVSLIA